MLDQTPGAIRIARPSRDLAAVAAFYVDLIGLEFLGGFEDHAGFNGRFVGPPAGGWHLEFTTSPEPVLPAATEEDLLVLFLDPVRISEIAAACSRAGIAEVPLPNPYWQAVDARCYRDPDGYPVVLRPAVTGSASPGPSSTG